MNERRRVMYEPESPQSWLLRVSLKYESAIKGITAGTERSWRRG